MSKTFKPAIRAFGSLKRSAGQLFTAVRPIFSAIGKLAAGVFVTGFRATFRIAAGVISGLLTAVAPIVTGILKVFTGITTFLTGVFTGNWKKAWQGIKGIFSGIAATFVGIIKAPINGMIGIINGFVGAVNAISFDIPKGFPFMGGKHIGFNIPKLKYLAKGTNNWEGGPVAINEKGGEIVDLPSGTRVYPHDKSIQKAREDGAAKSNKTVHKYDQRNITITISKVADNVTVSGDGDIDSLANKLADALRDQLLNMA
jgi:phage-related protein